MGPLLFDGAAGTIVGASTEKNSDECGGIPSDGPGVWYFTYGTGAEMMAHTCRGTEFDSKVSIFAGSCENPQCIGSDDDFCGTGSAVSWKSVHNEKYFILVQLTAVWK